MASRVTVDPDLGSVASCRLLFLGEDSAVSRGSWPLEDMSAQWMAQGLLICGHEVFQHRVGLEALPTGRPTPARWARLRPESHLSAPSTRPTLLSVPSERVGTAGPAQQTLDLSLNRLLPEWPLPLPSSPLHLSSPCPKVPCVCLYILNIQGFLESGATSKWTRGPVLTRQGREGASGHSPVCHASEPLRLPDRQSCLPGARPDENP